MNIIENQSFDAERALYGSEDLTLKNCVFDGPADGESALKESRGITVERCRFGLRYPFWHDDGLFILDSELTEKCRAALWYAGHVSIRNSRLHGIKALRECSVAEIAGCDIVSSEFGWNVRGCKMRDTRAEGEYFMLRSSSLLFRNVTLRGKYSFQYIENSSFENCNFDTKDAFWHAKNVAVRNSVVKGEYLAWYSENLTLENCTIIGTQPFCYCRGLRLVNCRMTDTDLAFERSEVEATVTTPVLSIKNPMSGSRICVPAVGEIIRDIPGADGDVTVCGKDRYKCA